MHARSIHKSSVLLVWHGMISRIIISTLSYSFIFPTASKKTGWLHLTGLIFPAIYIWNVCSIQNDKKRCHELCPSLKLYTHNINPCLKRRLQLYCKSIFLFSLQSDRRLQFIKLYNMHIYIYSLYSIVKRTSSSSFILLSFYLRVSSTTRSKKDIDIHTHTYILIVSGSG